MFLLSPAILTVLALACAAEMGLRIMQLFAAIGRRGTGPAPRSVADDAAFVSVHVPTCNEPPALVIATLECLARSRFDRFEVIVMSNNTVDPALWQPLESAVHRLGRRFRFVHVERVAGAKAGALNLALAATDPAATHVAIVDADYQVDPGFLAEAVAAAHGAGADYVQFPQAYRGVGQEARGIDRELHDYFACFAESAGRVGAMLPTGTLSLFRIAALRDVGGWPCATITEDAEIGLALQRAGYRGVWLDRACGWGLLPLDLPGIRKQRARWSAGNVQVLRQMCVNGALASRAGLAGTMVLVTQLTAWVSLVLPAALTLVLVGVAPRVPLGTAMIRIAATTILGSAVLTALRLMAFGSGAAPVSARIEAVVTRAALSWTSATAWIPALVPMHLRFHRTAKAADSRRDDDCLTLIVSGLFLCLAALEITRGEWLAMTACLVLATVWPCGRFVDAALRRAAAANPELA